MKNKQLLITDLDNTLFDWFNIWYYSFSAMLNKTSEITKIPKQQLIEEIRPIHQKHGTAEYAFVLQEIPSLLKLYGNPEIIKEELDEAIHAHRSARKDHLTLYQGVHESLTELKQRGTRVVAYTESKEWYSKFRLKKLGLDSLIDVLYSPTDHHVPIPQAERTEINLERTICKNTPENELKPNPKLLKDIIEEERYQVCESVYIGDSLLKDMEMAIQAGVDEVHAEYGNQHFQTGDERYDLLRAVTHWTDDDVRREKEIIDNKLGLQPKRVAKQFPDILSFFNFGEK